jgi:ubiquinone/menaquinone biosynthesis C-methylase UbiE
MIGVREMDIDFYRYYARTVEAARGPVWRYDERKCCGVNFSNFLVASHYDRYHETFRNYRQEAEQIVATLGLDSSATVLDMGCGTGAFAIHAAPHYRRIYAVDIAQAMLGRARRKAKKAGLTNIEFHRGGFLTYEHADSPVDAVVSVLALHHLPDFWKLAGLHRLASMLRPDGRLYLLDVVFSFDIGGYEACVERFLEKMSAPPQDRPAEGRPRRTYATSTAPGAGSWRACSNEPASKSMRPTTKTISWRPTFARGNPTRCEQRA